MPVFEPPEPPEPPEPHIGPLIGADEDWWNNACLNPFGTSWTVYAEGYLAAARILVARVGETREDQDLLVYPIVFLCRQYLELTLKYLLTTTRELLGQNEQSVKGHSLLAPWRELPGLVRQLEERMDQEVVPSEDIKEIDRLISEFEAVDRTSFTFRYPVDNVGNSSLPSQLSHVNVRRLIDGMNRLSYLLERLVLATDYFNDYFGPGAEP